MRRRITYRSWSFVALWALGVTLLLWSGTQVDGYKLYVLGEPLPHPYPWQGVFVEIGILSVESLAFYAVIRPESYSNSWLRALASLLLSLGLLVFFGLMLMHAPPHAVWHWLWLAFVCIAFLSLLGISGVNAFRAHAA
jgi:drug/metabolite transporter (DMT)-like permease